MEFVNGIDVNVIWTELDNIGVILIRNRLQFFVDVS